MMMDANARMAILDKIVGALPAEMQQRITRQADRLFLFLTKDKDAQQVTERNLVFALLAERMEARAREWMAEEAKRVVEKVKESLPAAIAAMVQGDNIRVVEVQDGSGPGKCACGKDLVLGFGGVWVCPTHPLATHKPDVVN